MNAFTITKDLEISPGIAVEKSNNVFQIRLSENRRKILHRVSEKKLKEGKVMQLFPVMDYAGRKLYLNDYFGKGQTTGVIIFLEHVNFIKNSTILGKRLWIEPPANETPGNSGILIIGFDSTKVIAAQIEGEIFLFSQDHPELCHSVSQEDFLIYQEKAVFAKQPRVALAEEVKWLIINK